MDQELLLANFILPIVKDIVAPKISSVISKLLIKDVDSNNIEENFNSYLTQRYEKFFVINTLVFPNKQTSLESLYQPLTLETEDLKQNTISIQINDYPKEFIPEYCRVIIEDTAGMGKSTIAKKLFLSIIQQKAGIPILIELSQINKKNSILKEIQTQLSPIGKKINQDFILKLINEGEFIFLFDGLDEISLDDKQYAVREIHKFIEKANNNYFLLTSRPEDSLSSFGDFQRFKVKPLEKGEAYSLLNKYDTYSYQPISKKLIKQLNDNRENSLQEYLTNPFLVSLLYKSYEYKKDIPVKKSQFYQQVFDALFETHDLSKEGYLKRDKYSNLHIDDFERVLRYVGYFSSIDNKVEFEKNELIKYIDKAKKYLPDLSFRSSDFLKDLVRTVPLFKKEGNNYKWAHKSLQDYFAAKFLWIDSKGLQENILKKIYSDPQNKRFYNMLDIFYELDTKAFDTTILKWILQEFSDFADNNYEFYSPIDSLLKTRLENHFNKECKIIVTTEEDSKTFKKGSDVGNKIYHSYSKKVNCRNCFTNFNYFSYPEVVAFSYIKVNKSKETILQLISTRLPDLAEYRNHKVHLDNLILIQVDQPYELNDNENNILNDKNVFSLTNDLIIGSYSLKYDNAIKKHNQLKRQESKQNNIELLDW